MLPEARTPEGKVVLYHRASGQRMERWPVDARDMVRSGDYTTDAPSGETGDSPAVPVTTAPTALPHEYAPGVPLLVTRSIDAPPAKPFAGATRSRGKK